MKTNEQDPDKRPEAHRHAAERVHVVVQRRGVPYEIEQLVCSDCHAIIDEKPLKRAAA